MYIVVFENIRGYDGQKFKHWNEFRDKAHFKEVFFEQHMHEEFVVVKEDVSQEEATRLCSTPTCNIQVLANQLQALSDQIQQKHED
jgi:hypothetical protein